MPHFIIECSKNLLKKVAPEEILSEVYKCAELSNLFAKEGVGGIKVRINSYTDFITVGAKDEFIHVFGNIMEGRSIEQKSSLSKSIVSKLKSMFPEVSIISMNIQEFEKATYSNLSTL